MSSTCNSIVEEFNKLRGGQIPLTLRELTLITAISNIVDKKELTLTLDLSNKLQEAIKQI